MIREIILFGNYFIEFYDNQPQKVQEKIEFVLDLIRNIKVVPTKFLKHLTGTDGLYEVRVQVGNNIYRIFCFFDEGNLVVLMNGFQKKTQKTPRKEIEKALKIKQQYFEDKNQ